MSIDMYLDDSNTQGNSAKAMALRDIEAYTEIEAALRNFETSSDQLKGKAYDSARAYSEAVLRPLARGGRMLADAVGTAVKYFPEAYVEQVAAESLKESELMADIAELDSQIIQTNQTINSLNSTNSTNVITELRLSSYLTVVNAATAAKATLQEKLDKLRLFNSTSPALFLEIDILKSLIDQGLEQLSSGWDAEQGVYVLPADLSWAAKLNQYQPQQPRKPMATDKEQIIQDYMDSYGLDYEAASILYNLQQGILDKAEEEDWSNKKVLYEYNRLIASFVPDNYVSTRWKSICGTVDKAERDKLCKEYGLSDSEIASLETAIEDQHKDGNQAKDLAHEAVQIAAFTEESWVDYSIKQNGPHNVSHIMNEDLEHEEISFKGDIDSGRYDDTDFNSDLDAINTYRRAIDEDTDREDVFRVSAVYNNGIRDNSINRVEEFYDNYDEPGKDGKEVVKEIVERETMGSWYISSDYEDEEKAQHKKDFYDYLKRGEEENVG